LTQQQKQQMVELLGVALTRDSNNKGYDVAVIGHGDTLIFDCTKALDPRTACYILYKGYPTKGDLILLQMAGVHTLYFKTERGIFSTFTWDKSIP
jgi:hypothetical protein